MYLNKAVRTFIIIFIFLLLHMECKTQSITALKQEGDTANTTIRVFVGDFEKEQLVYKEFIEIRQCQEDDAAYLSRMLKEYPDEEGAYSVGISNASYIKHIQVDPYHEKVYVDMSTSYNEMNYGTLGEYLALQSLAYTVGDYYDVNQVVITVEEQPYSSGHFYFEQGESILIDTQLLQMKEEHSK